MNTFSGFVQNFGENGRGIPRIQNDVQRVIADFIDNYNYIDSIYITANNLGAVGGSQKRTLVYDRDAWQKSFSPPNPSFRRLNSILS